MKQVEYYKNGNRTLRIKYEGIKKLLEKQDKEIERLHSIIKEVREYIKNLTNFQIGYGLNENDIKRTMYASENNFVKDILDIVDKGER